MKQNFVWSIHIKCLLKSLLILFKSKHVGSFVLSVFAINKRRKIFGSWPYSIRICLKFSTWGPIWTWWSISTRLLRLEQPALWGLPFSNVITSTLINIASTVAVSTGSTITTLYYFLLYHGCGFQWLRIGYWMTDKQNKVYAKNAKSM